MVPVQTMNEVDCKICESKQAKYTCPRCNIWYCSVACYKSQQHVECSEGFFRENVVQELALREADAGNAKSMLEILQRVEHTNAPDDEALSDGSDSDGEAELDSDDYDREDELSVRLEGIDLDNADSVWERLTAAEKEEFQCFVENGSIAKLLPEPDIWWTREYKLDLVQLAEVQSQQELELLQACPKVWNKIPKIEDIFNKQPSPAVRHNIANILAAYAFVYRLFYGDIIENTLEATDCLLSICLNLQKGTAFDSESLAVESVTSECRNGQLPVVDSTTAVLKADVRTFFAGPRKCGKKYKKIFLLAALSDVRSLFSRANQELKDQMKPKDVEKNGKLPNEEPVFDKSDFKHIDGPLIRGCRKKIDFFLAYASSTYL